MLGLAALAWPVAAQVIRGTVRHAETEAPLADAFVTLLDTAGVLVQGLRTDARGRYAFRVSDPGVYAISAARTGHLVRVSGWVGIAAADSLEVNFRLPLDRRVLPQVTITAQRDALMEHSVDGISLRTLAGTLVTQMEVERAAESTMRFTEVVQNLRIPSLLLRQFRVNVGDPRVDGERSCLAYGRGAPNRPPCVTVVLDGVRLATLEALVALDNLVSAERVKGMVFLRPAEAGTLFGSDGSNGVLVIVTKEGGR